MNMHYQYPGWTERTGNWNVSISTVEEWKIQTEKVNQANAADYNRVLREVADCRTRAVKLFGNGSNVVLAIDAQRVPKPPDFTDAWKKVLARIAAAKKQTDERRRNEELHQMRVNAGYKAALTRRENEIAREEYLDGMPYSD